MSDHGRAESYGETWAAVYDDEYQFLNPEPAVAFLAELGRGLPTLELGIGTGRVALPLRAHGVEVRGVDASEAMVERLRVKPGGTLIDVAMGDMATMPLGGPYGLVFVVFNTFFALGDQQRQVECFKNVAAVLQPGGRFLVECFVPDVNRFRDGNQTVRVVSMDEAHLRLNASLHDPVHQTVCTQVVVVRDGSMWARPVAVRYCWPAEMDLMARLAGLDLEARWSGWAEEPFTSQSNQHISIYQRPTS